MRPVKYMTLANSSREPAFQTSGKVNTVASVDPPYGHLGVGAQNRSQEKASHRMLFQAGLRHRIYEEWTLVNIILDTRLDDRVFGNA